MFDEHHSSLQQQGYLQYITNNSNEKVFAVLSNNKFICYPEDPLKSPAARLAPIVSFDMNYSKIVDGGPNVKRPKSFAISSGNDGRVTGEFVCPTNSIKCQWIKSILDSSKSPLILAPKVFVSAESRSNQSNNYGATNSPIVLSPQQPKMQLISLNRSTTPSRPLNNYEEYSAHRANNYRSSSGNQFNHQSQGYPNDNINTPSTSFANPLSQPSQSSLLLSSQRGGLTSDGQLKITRRAIGPSLVTGSGQNGQSNVVSKPKPLPGWVPNTYGNNKIKSRKVSPQRASATEADNKRPVRGSSRQDSRADQRPSKDPHSNYFHFHEDDANNQQQQYSLQQPHSQQQYEQQPLSSSSHRGSAGSGSRSGSTGNRIDNLTVSELREALLAIPPHLRSSLVQGSDHSPPQQGDEHDERHGSGGQQRGRGDYEIERSTHNNTGRSKSAGPSHRDSQRHEESRHRDSGREPDRHSDHRRSDTYRSGNDRERSQSAQPNYRKQQRSASQSSSRSASPPQRRPSRENANKNVDRQYDHDSTRRRDHRGHSGDDYSSASEQDGTQEERDGHRGQQQRHRSKSPPQSRPQQQQHRAGAAPIVIDVHYRHSEDEEENSDSSEDNFGAREEGRHSDHSEDESLDSYGESPAAIDKKRLAAHVRKGREDRHDQQDYQQSRGRGRHDRSASPSERERNRDRDSRSASRQRDNRATTHAPKPATSRSQSAIPTRSAAMAPKSESRSPSALARSGHRRLEGDLQDERMGSSVDRKSALEWSRKLAHDKKIHADFPSSPLLHSQHSGANVNSKPQLQTTAATPSTPLKYKYKSFSDSLERGEPPRRETVPLHSPERVGSNGQSLARSQQPQKQAPASQNAPPQHQSNGSERKAAVPKVTFPSKTQSKGGGFLDFLGSRKGAAGLSAEKPTVVQPAVSVPAMNENLDPAVRVNLDMLARYRAKQQQGGNIPPPVAVMNRHKLAARDSAAPAPQRSTQQPGYPSFIRPPPQQKGPSRDNAVVAQIQSQFDDLSSIEQEPFSPVQPSSNMRRSSSQEFDHPAPSSNGPFNSEVTDMAEWRRLNDWLLRNELDEYSELLRAHGITKLSILELLSAEDMRNIGIAEDDIDVAVRKVSEFTRRTRTFSEQVFYSDAEGTAAVPMPRVKPVPAKPLPASEGGKQSAGGTSKMPYLGAAAKLSALSIPAAKSKVASTETQVVSTASPVAVYETKAQLRHELIVHFDCGNNELFFRAWKVATVVHFPSDYIQLNPLRPSLFNTKQIMEFHLYLYFSVHPIMTNSSKEAVRRGKDALKAYLESMVASSEHSSLLNGEAPQTTAFTPRDNSNKDGNNEAADGQQIMSPADTATSMFSTPSLRSVTASSFMRSREFAIYAGMVMVPEPQSNEAFIQLFKHDWMAAMRVRFVQFLDIVGLTSSNDPPLVGKESDENVNVLPEENLDAPMATPKPFRPVSTALFLPSQTTPRSQHSGLETPQVYSRVSRTSAAQQETDKEEEEEHDDKAERSARLQRQSQQVTDNTDNLDTSDTYPSRNDVQVAAAVSSHVSHVVPPPPLDTLLSPISPEEHAKKRHGVISSVENLTSPMSTTSTISQLTDDDNNYVSNHHTVSGHKGAPATNQHISPVHTQQHPRKSLLGATSSPLIGNSSNSAANGSRGKPFTPMSRSAMQSQVNEYNKLLKQGGMKPAPVAAVGSAAAAIVSDEIAVTEQHHLLSPVLMTEGTKEETIPKKLTHGLEPTVVASESEDISKVGNSNSTPQRTSLVLGSGLKPRPIMSASSMNKILLPRDASMQNQVDGYNKLLKTKPVVLPVETVATSASSETESSAVEDNREFAVAEEVKTVEAGDQVALAVEEIVESEIKEVAAEAVEKVQPVESGEVSEQVEAETTTVELQTEPVLESVAAQSESVASVEMSDELTAEEHLNSTRNEKNTVDGDGGPAGAAPEPPAVSELSEVEEDSSRQPGPAVESSVFSVPHPAVSEMARQLASVDTLDTTAIAAAAGSLYSTSSQLDVAAVPVTVDAEALQPISLAAEEPSEKPAEEPQFEESKAAPAEIVKNDALLAEEEETTGAADLTPVKHPSKKNKKHNKSKKQ